jgi:hypothetical protein
MQSVQLQRWSGDEPDRRFDWETIEVVQALGFEGPFRCPECLQPVRLHKASSDGANPAHAEHRVGSKTCTLSYYYE